MGFSAVVAISITLGVATGVVIDNMPVKIGKLVVIGLLLFFLIKRFPDRQKNRNH